MIETKNKNKNTLAGIADSVIRKIYRRLPEAGNYGNRKKTRCEAVILFFVMEILLS